MGADFLVVFDDFSRRYWPLIIPAVFLTAWFFHLFLFRQQLRFVLQRLRRHQISGRKERRRLQESEERLRIILSAIQTGVAVINPTSRKIEFVNPAACKMIGLAKESIVGRRIEEFELREGRRTADEFRGLVSAADGVRHRHLHRSGGEHFPVLEKVATITINGVVFTLKSYLDLTELAVTRRQVERLHANLTKRVQELHCLFGVAGYLGDASLTQGEVLTKVTRLLPPAMTFPHLAGARLSLDDQVTATEKFQETPWRMSHTIEVAGDKRGQLEISYLEDPSLEDERLFVKEERGLLETVCLRVARYLEGLEAAQDRALFKGLMDHTSDAVFVFEQGSTRLTYGNLPACHLLGLQRQELLTRTLADIFTLEDGTVGLISLLEEQGVGRSIVVELGLRVRGGSPVSRQITALLLGHGVNSKVALLLSPQAGEGAEESLPQSAATF